MFRNYNKKKIHRIRGGRGFTLIETFVAITVLMIAVLGPMTLLSRALQESRYLKDQITAFYLAQEGVELVIHYRNNVVAGAFDPSYFTSTSDSSSPSNFYWDETNGFNLERIGKPTIFSRQISVAKNVNDVPLSDKEYLITSTVTYPIGVTQKTVTASSFIFAN